MERQEFVKVMQDVLDSLPEEFRSRIRNVAVLVEDFPPRQTPSRHPKKLLLGLFHGVPMTKKSIFDLPTGPDYVVLYQKNIEAVCSTEAEVREQIRRTVEVLMSWLTLLAPHTSSHVGTVASSSGSSQGQQPTPDELAYSMDIAIGERFRAPSSIVASSPAITPSRKRRVGERFGNRYREAGGRLNLVYGSRKAHG